MIFTDTPKQDRVMRADYTGHISSAEWRWVTVMSSALVLLALLPFLWIILNAPAESQFMGAIHDYPAAASNLAKVVQGMRGEWLARYIHTPEPHNGVLIDTLYILLGQLARLTSIPSIIIFHVARVGAAIFMYAAIYHLAASIWMRVRTRRIFFILAVRGSGLGWLFAPLTQSINYPDLVHVTPYPFAVSLVNVHLPLAIGCLAMLAGAMVEVLRPGINVSPRVDNAGMTVFSSSLVLIFIYPQAFFPIAIASIALLLSRAIYKRKPIRQSLRWILWLGVPALPLIVYYTTVFLFNPVVAQVWVREHQAAAPSFPILLIGLGLPLIIALPGLIRGVRRFEPDGNQFMLLWLLSMLLLTYLTPVIQMNFALGLMLPIAYFGARASEDFWFNLIHRPWRYRLVVALIPIIAISHLYLLFLPVTAQYPQSSLLLHRNYALAFRWMYSQRPSDDIVVLTAPQVGTWLPAWTGTRVVYGYLSETLDGQEKLQAVQHWYSDERDCERLLNGEWSTQGDYQVSYVLYGPLERAINDGEETACLRLIMPTVSFGDLVVYRYVPR